MAEGQYYYHELKKACDMSDKERYIQIYCDALNECYVLCEIYGEPLHLHFCDGAIMFLELLAGPESESVPEWHTLHSPRNEGCSRWQKFLNAMP